VSRLERDTVRIDGFEFERGGRVPRLDLAYEAHGDPADPTVLVCHALTGSANVTGVTEDATDDAADGDDETPAWRDGLPLGGQARAWWEGVVGPGRAVDTDRYHVVCVNVPGSCYGSTGPASTNPDTGEPYGPDFPAVTVGDWTDTQALVLDALGVDHLHAVVGGSLGGMNALEWARRFPDRVDRVAPVATAARLDPQCLALDAVAARAITSDPDWRGGRYYDGDHPDDGLALARMVGHLMYLSKASMRRRFGRREAADPPTPAAPTAATRQPTVLAASPYRAVASYLDYNAARFVRRFDANSYLRLLRAMDDYDLAAGHGSDAAALADFDGEALVCSLTGDWHFTVEAATRLAGAFDDAGAAVDHCVLETDYGHDAFLTEPGLVGPPLSAFLDGGVAAVGDCGAAAVDGDGDDRGRGRPSPLPE